MRAHDYEQVALSPGVWSRVNDQEAGCEESKEGAPGGHHGNDADAANRFYYSAQS